MYKEILEKHFKKTEFTGNFDGSKVNFFNIYVTGLYAKDSVSEHIGIFGKKSMNPKSLDSMLVAIKLVNENSPGFIEKTDVQILLGNKANIYFRTKYDRVGELYNTVKALTFFAIDYIKSPKTHIYTK